MIDNQHAGIETVMADLTNPVLINQNLASTVNVWELPASALLRPK
jgi:hypothetical protein